ncbi:MAG: hypothetical protein K6D97_00840 [Clostridia bacterium]|nr:hypothetical protein [Clostridia bacterium]
MQEKEGSFIKETERGREVYIKLHELIKEYNKGVYSYGRASEMVELYISNLSENDFYLLMRLPIGNMARTHYTQIRRRVQKERGNVLLVYYEKEEEKNIADFYKYLRSEGFNGELTGPINSPDCPWVYVFIEKKEFKVGKPGIDFAPKRYIEHAVLIDEFKLIYDIYHKTKTLDDSSIYALVEKYKKYSIFCFNSKENINNKIKRIKNNITAKISNIKFKYYYNRYSTYEEYKNKVLLCMVKYNGYPNREGAMIDYKCYEEELFEEFINHKESNPSSTAYYISMGF